MIKICIIIITWLFVLADPLYAEQYKVSLTRRDQNFYEVDRQNLFIRTKYCYEYGYGQDAIIDTENKKVIFLGYSPNTCDLDMILKPIG